MADIECLTPEGLAQVWGKVKGEINKAVSVVYKPGGNKAASELTSSLLVAANLGYVYNLTTEATTTSDWTEVPGKTIAAGTDVGVVAVTENNSTVYKFNAYATKIDLSAYQTKNLSEAIGGQSTVEGSLAALNSGKADKDTDAVEGHLAKFDANSNPVDSGIAAGNVAQKDGSYDQMQVGVAKDLASSQSVPAEIVFRNTGGSTSVGRGGAAFIDRIKGKTLVWNQLVSGLPLESGVYNGLTVTNNGDGTYTLNGTTTETFDHRVADVNVLAGHKYFVRLDVPNVGANFAQVPAFTLDANGRAITTPASSETRLYITIGSGVTLNNVRVTPQVTDLTLAGIADEISIPADFEALYPGYHDHDEGTLISNDASAIETVGLNQWDEEWELGSIDGTTGENTPDSTSIRSMNYIKVTPGASYYFCNKGQTSLNAIRFRCYDANKTFVPGSVTYYWNNVITIPNGVYYIRFSCLPSYGTTYNHDVCINLSDPSRNGTYEPYWKSVMQLGLDSFKVKSHNIWDEEWEEGKINSTDGTNSTDETRIRSKNYIPVFGGQKYYLKNGGGGVVWFFTYDANKNYLTYYSANNAEFIPSAETAYIRICPDASYGTTYNNDICINLSSSFNGQYEPHGDITITGCLKGDSTWVDILYSNNHLTNKAKRVNLGTLTWGYSSGYFYANVSGKSVGIGNLICSRYANTTASLSELPEKSIRGHASTNAIYVKDSSYNDAAAFTAAMSGVLLDFELATPIEYELVEALPTEYRVDSHGTERRLPEDTASSVHAPFCAEITYSTNIKETVENLPKNYINVDSMHAFLAALGTAMDGEWDMRQGNGRFIFTFTPNTPTNENE